VEAGAYQSRRESQWRLVKKPISHLGVTWPPQSGWIQKAVGRNISEAAAKAFLTPETAKAFVEGNAVTMMMIPRNIRQAAK